VTGRHALLLVLTVTGLAASGPGVELTRHNLSVSGPGPVRSTTETEICVFCHAAHVPTGAPSLWNHQTTDVVDYLPYSSPLLGATSTGVDGASRMCLSCHDGTIAVGAIASRRGPVRVEGTDAGGRLTSGRPSHLGTNLSGDHPVSIPYQDAVRFRSGDARTWLRDQPTSADQLRVDSSGRVQCTSCHDPHSDPAALGSPVPPFWKGDTFSDACSDCHVAPMATRAHGDPALLPNECGSCHVGHGRPGEALLTEHEEDNCFDCHGSAQSALAAVAAGRLDERARPTRVDDLFTRPYAHPVGQSSGIHRPDENLVSSGARTPRHVECADCHPTHTYRGAERPQWLPMSGTGRILLDGRPEAELCFDCHGSGANLPYGGTDKVREFNPANASFHPVTAAARGRSPSLASPWVSGDLITCSDCHGAEGGDPRQGPHGSANPYLLRGAYTLQDGATEALASYEACYSCHRRDVVLSDQSFVGHAQHVIQAQTSCYTCHDSHGSPDQPGLIRFNKDLRNGIVGPSASGRLEYDATTQSCRLQCHGVDHDPLGYP
jgi:predicted CXXCH cytochrome family protein